MIRRLLEESPPRPKAALVNTPAAAPSTRSDASGAFAVNAVGPDPRRRATRLLACRHGRRDGALRLAPRAIIMVVTEAARHLLEEFEALPDVDKREVVVELLRLSILAPHSSPSDEDLLYSADQVFLDLDRREAEG